MIKIDFTKSDGTYVLTDALYLPDDHTHSDQEIEQMKQDRFDKWLALLLTPYVDTTTSTNGVII